MSADQGLLLAMIRECIRTGRYAFTEHALTNHPPREGFTPRQALEAINNGTIIEHHDSVSRCLVCGMATGLALSPLFISTYIHCVCQYDRVNQVVIITMYRPTSAQWVNQHRRRRTWRGDPHGDILPRALCSLWRHDASRDRRVAV